MNFSFNDLLIAYKKAKSEVFYEKMQVAILEFPAYERNLVDNISKLLVKLESGEIDFVKAETFSNSNSFYPVVKRIDFLEQKTDEEKNVYYSNLKNRWKSRSAGVDNIEFRIISNLSVEFHIISSLWIDHFAYHLENELSKNSYGSRLQYSEDGPDQKLSHFRPYIYDYRRWQANGINVIRENLEKSEEVVALTADIRSFYHHINPEFLLNEDFLNSFDKFKNLSDEAKHLNKVLVNAIGHWSNNVYSSLTQQSRNSFAGQQHVGIPIGLAASKVIANLLLKDMDTAIEGELMPLYYGRYVDDIFLVLNHNKNIDNRKTLWTYIADRLKNLNYNTDNRNSYFKIDYAKDTRIDFNSDKERIFFLDKECGISILNEIERELNDNSSEWRLLPDAENDLDRFSEEVTQATSDATETANSLRKSDGISIQRLKYALFLRNAEELVLSHPKYFWTKGLKDLFRVTANFVIDPDLLPTYLQYMVKVLRLAVHTGDLKNFKRLWDSLVKSVKLINKGAINIQDEDLKLYQEYLMKNLELAILSGVDITKGRLSMESYLEKLKDIVEVDVKKESVEEFFICDLHFLPLKNIFAQQNTELLDSTLRILDDSNMNPFLVDPRGEEAIMAQPFINHKIRDANLIFENFIYQPNQQGKLPIGLFLLTRKKNYLEITRLLDRWLFEDTLLYQSFLRVFELPDFDVKPVTEGSYKVITANNYPCQQNPVIAITSFWVGDESWKSHVLGTLEPDKTRLKRLYDLIKGILLVKDRKIDYIVLPELAVPRYAISLISKQIKGRGITLITGAEYLIDRSAKTVRNQMVVVLPVTIKGRTHQVQIIQEKTIAAIHEEKELLSLASLKLTSFNKHKYIFQKNGFIFSGLICNDFLNIDNRQGLRGKIDGLFLIEWNKDIETYNSLVESTANDLHCFVIQVNNRVYGDTRIRAPYKEAYQRDISRIRGGVLDYFVISALDVKSLKDFQMQHISPGTPFKPVPTGFKMDERKKIN